MGTYWNREGTAQAKYDEMQAAGWEYTKKTEAIFHSYYRYYNDGDLPGWARGRYDLTENTNKYGYWHRALNAKGEQEFEDRVTEAITTEYKRFKKVA